MIDEKQRNRIAVLVPVSGRIEPDCETGLRALEDMGYPVWRVYGFSQIDVARNDLATKVLDAGCEGIMWIDSDTGFEPADVDKLVDFRGDAICGIYAMKSALGYAAYPLDGESIADFDFGVCGDIREITWAGMGFFFARREAYDKVAELMGRKRCATGDGRTVYPFFLPMVIDSGETQFYLGEDYAFCQRLRMAGIPIYADTTVCLAHIGMYGYTHKDVVVRRELARSGLATYSPKDVAEAEKTLVNSGQWGRQFAPLGLAEL